MNKILVTGATGFVGQRLIQRLQMMRMDPTCLVRRQSHNKTILQNFGAKMIECELSDLEELSKIAKGFDSVVHLAGSVFDTDKETLWRVNVQGTANLYTALKGSQANRFIFMSSLAAVGPVQRGMTINEKTVPRPQSLYGHSKLEAEHRLEYLSKDIGKSICIVRAPLIYGKGFSLQSRLATFIDRHLNKSFRFIGDGENVISLCQVDNLVSFLLKALEFKNLKNEIFHVADPTMLTMRTVSQIVSDILKIEAPTRYIPQSVARIIAHVNSCIARLTPSQPYLTLEREKELLGSWAVDLSKIIRWEFTPLDDWRIALSEAVQWYLSQRNSQ